MAEGLAGRLVEIYLVCLEDFELELDVLLGSANRPVTTGNTKH